MSRTNWEAYSPYLLAVTLFMGALWIRAVGLLENGLWLDEISVLHVVVAPWNSAFGYMNHNVHPPTFWLLARAWGLCVGATEFSLRLIPLMLGSLTAPVAFLALRRHLGMWGGFAAGFVVLALPGHVDYSRLVRPYCLGALVSVLTVSAFLSYLERPDRRRGLLLALSTAAMFYVHFVTVLGIASVVLCVGLLGEGDRRSRAKQAGGLAFVIGLLMLPLLPHFLQGVAKTKQYWPPPITRETVWHLLRLPFGGEYSGIAAWLILVCPAVFAPKGKRRASVGVLLLTVLPVLLLITACLLRPKGSLMVSRIAILATGPLAALAGLGVASVPWRGARVVLLSVSVVLFASTYHQISFFSLPRQGQQRWDWVYRRQFGLTTRAVAAESQRLPHAAVLGLDGHLPYEGYAHFLVEYGSKSPLKLGYPRTPEKLRQTIRETLCDQDDPHLIVFGLQHRIMPDPFPAIEALLEVDRRVIGENWRTHAGSADPVLIVYRVADRKYLDCSSLRK